MMPDVEHSCCGGNVEAPNKGDADGECCSKKAGSVPKGKHNCCSGNADAQKKTTAGGGCCAGKGTDMPVVEHDSCGGNAAALKRANADGGRCSGKAGSVPEGEQEYCGENADPEEVHSQQRVLSWKKLRWYLKWSTISIAEKLWPPKEPWLMEDVVLGNWTCA